MGHCIRYMMGVRKNLWFHYSYCKRCKSEKLNYKFCIRTLIMFFYPRSRFIWRDKKPSNKISFSQIIATEAQQQLVTAFLYFWELPSTLRTINWSPAVALPLVWEIVRSIHQWNFTQGLGRVEQLCWGCILYTLISKIWLGICIWQIGELP